MPKTLRCSAEATGFTEPADLSERDAIRMLAILHGRIEPPTAKPKPKKAAATPAPAKTMRTTTPKKEETEVPCTCPTTTAEFDPTPPDTYGLRGKEHPKATNERKFTSALLKYCAAVGEADRQGMSAEDLERFQPPDTYGLRAAQQKREAAR